MNWETYKEDKEPRKVKPNAKIDSYGIDARELVLCISEQIDNLIEVIK